MKTGHQVLDERRAREGVATDQGDTDTPPVPPPEETGSEPGDPSASSGKGEGRCQGRNNRGQPCGNEAITDGFCRHHSSTDLGGDTDRGPSQATVLAEIAEARAELWHDADGTEHATVDVGDHVEHHRLRSRPFKTWLRRRYWELNRKAPGSEGVQAAVETLCGIALFDGAEHPVAVRLGGDFDAVYLDLADTGWRVAEVTANGWQLIDAADCPVRFVRAKGMRSLPEPESGGRLEELREFINVSDDDWPLVAAHEVGCLHPRGPYPVLELCGEWGSAKTTQARMLRRLFDPHDLDVRSRPSNERDLAIAACSSAVVALDNLSGIQPWLSDTLARLATGAGFGTRTLYENDEETLFSYCRPAILTAVNDVATAGDLLSRTIIVELPRLDEDTGQVRDEQDLWAAYRAAHPRLLGALLDAVACALRRLPDVRLDRPPRMADFARWVTAAEPALGLDDGEFMRRYRANRQAGKQRALDASPVGPAVGDLMTYYGEWLGTAEELLAAITPADREERRQLADEWPTTARGMAGALKSIAPELRGAGIDVEPPGRNARPRRWRLTRRSGVATDATDATDGTPGTPEDRARRSGDGSDGHPTDRRATDGQPSDSKPLAHPHPVGSDGSDGREPDLSSGLPEGWSSGEPVWSCVAPGCGRGAATRDPQGRPRHPRCPDPDGEEGSR
jgi:hypothetical protein